MKNIGKPSSIKIKKEIRRKNGDKNIIKTNATILLSILTE
jgi:hypothetical protein